MDDDRRKTIVLMGVFGFLGIAIMAVRLIMRKVRGQKFNLSDYLTMAAILCLMARTAFTTVVVLWGNNNLTTDYRASHWLSPTDVDQREVGSKLTIVNRVTYRTYIWIQKAVVLLLYHQVLSGLDLPRRIMKFYWVVLVVTYLVSQVVTFVECRPLYLYWQVLPDPEVVGACSQAPLQLTVFVSLNIITDFMLIILPMPWLIKVKVSIKERLQLVALFSVGFFVIAIAFVRLPINWGNGTAQINRNVWGSVEAFAAAFVANVPTLFALRHRPNTHNSRPGSYCMRNNVRLSGLGQVEREDISITRGIDLECIPSRQTSELSSPRGWESWHGLDSNDEYV